MPHDPTIIEPGLYKDRFKRAISNYFMAILSDKPCDSFKTIITR